MGINPSPPPLLGLLVVPEGREGTVFGGIGVVVREPTRGRHVEQLVVVIVRGGAAEALLQHRGSGSWEPAGSRVDEASTSEELVDVRTFRRAFRQHGVAESGGGSEKKLRALLTQL